jgi:pimeloyl-ACP methyl ester carboxylesterase
VGLEPVVSSTQEGEVSVASPMAGAVSHCGLVVTRALRGDDACVDRMKSIRVGDVDLEAEVMGDGEPVVLIQTALTADELRPLAEQMAQSGGYQLIHYHRRGYAGSGPLLCPGSVAAEVADCRALLEALEVGPAHVVGVSYSAAIALTLASRVPDEVRTLTVMEPPPLGVPSAPEFLAASAHLSETFNAKGSAVALDELLTMLAGPDWRRESERDLQGSVAAMERDALTFFESDLPALLAWEFGTEDAARIKCPVLYVGGSNSGLWFAEVRARILQLLPQTEDCTVQGAGHLLALTHPIDTAKIVVDFLRRHPWSGVDRTVGAHTAHSASCSGAPD